MVNSGRLQNEDRRPKTKDRRPKNEDPNFFFPTKKKFANEENRFYIKSEKKSYIHFQTRPNNAPALLIFCSLATRFNGGLYFFLDSHGGPLDKQRPLLFRVNGHHTKRF